MEITELAFYLQGLAGYIAKCEFLGEIAENPPQIPQRKPKACTFQFRIDQETPLFLGGFFEEPVSEIRSVNYQDFSSRADFLYSFQRNAENSEEISAKPREIRKNSEKNLAESIKTLRLFQGKLLHLEEFELESEENSEGNERNSVFKRNSEEDDDENAEISFEMSRKDVNYVLTHQKKPRVLRFLQGLAAVAFFQSFFFTYLVFFSDFNENSKLSPSLSLLKSSYISANELQKILFSANSLYLLGNGVRNASFSSESLLKSQINASVSALKTANLFLTGNSQGISKRLDAILNENTVEISFSLQTSQKFSLSEATDQLISKSFALINAPLSDFRYENLNYLFLLLNIYGDYWEKAAETRAIYYENLTNALKTSDLLVISLLASSLSAGLLALSLVFALKNIRKRNENTLNLLLLLKEAQLRAIYRRNENFLSFLQTGDDENEEFSEEDDISLRKGQETADFQPKKRRKSKKLARTSAKLAVFLGVCAVCMEFFLFFAYFYQRNVNEMLGNALDFFQLSCQAESKYLVAYNCQQNLAMERDFLLQNASLRPKCGNYVEEMSTFQSDYLQVRENSRKSRYFFEISLKFSFSRASRSIAMLSARLSLTSSKS